MPATTEREGQVIVVVETHRHRGGAARGGRGVINIVEALQEGAVKSGGRIVLGSSCEIAGVYPEPGCRGTRLSPDSLSPLVVPFPSKTKKSRADREQDWRQAVARQRAGGGVYLRYRNTLQRSRYRKAGQLSCSFKEHQRCPALRHLAPARMHTFYHKHRCHHFHPLHSRDAVVQRSAPSLRRKSRAKSSKARLVPQVKDIGHGSREVSRLHRRPN